MLVAGGFVLIWRRDRSHALLWFALIAYWMVGGIIQDITFNNSIPYPNMFMALLVGFVAVRFAAKTRTMWPLWISIFMVLSTCNDLWYATYTEVSIVSKSVRSIYQNTTYGLFFLSLAALCHPLIRKRHVGNSWVYS